jgi:alpha-ribazole phosphatase
MSDLENNSSLISLLRHGETTAGKCFLGTTDAELSDLGWQQMRSAELSNDYDLVISSPLLRCQKFARQYASEINRPLRIETGFREIDFGEWEAKTAEELWQTDQQALSDFWSDSVKCTPPGGESLLGFQRRVLDCYTSLPGEIKDKRVLIICHAGVIKILLCHVLGIELKNMHKLAIDHAGLSQISLWQDTELTHQVRFINRC